MLLSASFAYADDCPLTRVASVDLRPQKDDGGHIFAEFVPVKIGG